MNYLKSVTYPSSAAVASSGLMAAGATNAKSAKTKAKRNIIISTVFLDVDVFAFV